jgi:hypothetical protein
MLPDLQLHIESMVAEGDMESWTVRDDLGVLRQLGQLPAPASMR